MADSEHPAPEAGQRSVAFEPSDANVRGLLLTGAALGGLSVAIMIGLIPAYDLFARRADRHAGSNAPLAAGPLKLPRAPQLEGLPDQADQAQAAIDAGHAGYDWIDRRQQIARIPIERAMQLLPAKLPAPIQASQPSPPRDARLLFERTHPPGPSNSGRIVETDRDNKPATKTSDHPPHLK